MNNCEQCGLVYGNVTTTIVPRLLREQPHVYAVVIDAADSPGRLRARPAPGVWSAMEYLCHVRDVLQIQHERLQLALREARPTFSPMGRDERVSRDRYNEQDPSSVLTELERGCRQLADAFEGLPRSQWIRTGIYNWPEPAERTMAWLARHTIHELVHHLQDVRTVLTGAEPE